MRAIREIVALGHSDAQNMKYYISMLNTTEFLKSIQCVMPCIAVLVLYGFQNKMVIQIYGLECSYSDLIPQVERGPLKGIAKLNMS